MIGVMLNYQGNLILKEGRGFMFSFEILLENWHGAS